MGEVKKKSLSTIAAISLLVTTMMGTGITFMPFAFNCLGYIGSWIHLLLIAVGTFFSLLALAHVVKNSLRKEVSYAILALDVSKFEYYAVNLAIFFNSFFSNVGFYRFLSNILVDGVPFFKKLNSDEEVCRKFVVVLLIPILLYLCFKKNLADLKIIGHIGCFSVLFMMFLIVLYSFIVGRGVYNSEMKAFNTNFKYGVPFFISCMICQSNMIGVTESIKDKSWKNIIIISFFTSLVGMLAYGLVGQCGYIIFGSPFNESIITPIANMNSELNKYIRNNTIDKFNVLSKLAFFSMIFVLVSGFPLQLVPVVDLFMKLMYKNGFDQKIENKRRNIVIFLTFFACLMLVFIEKLDIKIIKRMSTAIFSTSAGLIHPFIFYFYSEKKNPLFTMIGSVVLVCASSGVLYIICTLIYDIFYDS